MTATMTDTERYLAAVRRIVLETLGDHPANVYLYGSHARGDTWRFSDVDVAIDPEVPLPSALLLDMCEALEESTVPYHVDVVDLSRVDAEFRDKVRAEGKLWNGSGSA